MQEFKFDVVERVDTVEAPKSKAWKWGLGATVVGGGAILILFGLT